MSNDSPQYLAKELNLLKKQVGSLMSKSPSPSSIPFSNTVPFKKAFTVMEREFLGDDVEFEPITEGARPGSVTLVKVVGHGGNQISFSGVKEVSGSAGFDDTDGIVNYLAFFYDGTDYWVNIYQEIGQVPIPVPDEFPPEVSTITVENANKNKIVITYDEVLNSSIVPANADFTISGKTVTNVQVSGAVVTVTVNSNYDDDDVITATYVPGTNKIQDTNGNLAAAFSALAVDNNISPAGPQNVVWTGLQNATDGGGGYITYGSGSPAGGRSNTIIDATQPFEITMYYPSNRGLTNAMVSYLSENTTQDYSWAANVFVLGVYQYEGAFYLPVGGYAATPLSTTGTVTAIKFVKSGNNILVQQSTDNTNFTTIQTVTGALTGKTNLYLKTLFAAPAGGNTQRITTLV